MSVVILVHIYCLCLGGCMSGWVHACCDLGAYLLSVPGWVHVWVGACLL